MSDLSLYEASRKSTGVAYLFWFFLGLIGAHRFYTRAGRTGWWMLLLHAGGWLLLAAAFWTHSEATTQTYDTAFGIGQMTEITTVGSGGPLALIGRTMRSLAWLWWLIDLFLVPGLVRRFNQRLAAGLGMRG